MPVQQHQALPTQQQPQITQQPFTSQSDFNIQELESYLLKIMQSCTKDNISVCIMSLNIESGFSSGVHGFSFDN